MAIDPWFLRNLEELVRGEKRAGSGELAPDERAQAGCGRPSSSASRTAPARTSPESMPEEPGGARAAPASGACVPVYKRVDTCAAEFEAHTPYLYSTYEDECEAEPSPIGAR